MVNYRLIALSFFSFVSASLSIAAGPYWDVKPSTWASGASLMYSVAFKGPRPWVDVIASSATGNGTTDDLAAIQRAISISTTSGGGIVYFPPGTYSISNQILVPDKVIIQGAGMASTTIKAAAGFPSGRDILHVGPNDTQNYTNPGLTYAQNIAVRDIHLDATNTSGVSYGIAAFGVDFFIAERVKVSSSSSYGIIVQGSTTTLMKSPWVMYCHFNRCGRTGGSDTLGGGHNSDARYIFNTFENCYGTAIDNVNVTRALWMGNRSINNSAGTGSMWSDYGMTDSQIVNNYLHRGSIHIYGELGSDRGAPSDVTISYNYLDQPGASAILVSPVNQVSTDTGTVKNLKIIGNTIYEAHDYALNIGDSPGCIISNNHIYKWDVSNGGSAAINLDSGVATTVGSTSCVVSGNTGVIGNSTLWYRENASSSQVMNNQVYGNDFGSDATYILSTNTPKTIYNDFKRFSKTLAQILAITPDYAGQQYYCSNCTTDAVCISTGTGVGAFVRASARTTVCN